MWTLMRQTKTYNLTHYHVGEESLHLTEFQSKSKLWGKQNIVRDSSWKFVHKRNLEKNIRKYIINIVL